MQTPSPPLLRTAALLGKDEMLGAANLLVQCPAIREVGADCTTAVSSRPQCRDPRRHARGHRVRAAAQGWATASGSGSPLTTLPLAGRVPQLGGASALAEVGRGCNRGQRNPDHPRSYPPPSSATSLSLLATLPPPQGGRWSPPCPRPLTAARNTPPPPSAPRPSSPASPAPWRMRSRRLSVSRPSKARTL